MPDLSVTYMGLPLRSPIIAGSSTLTITPEKVGALEKAGAGAVILKSLFEEQIRAEVAEMYDSLADSTHPEAYEYLEADLPMQVGPSEYLDRIRSIKASTGIPVIASLNCVDADRWVSFARKIESAGADAIELNVYDIADDPETRSEDIERRHLNLVGAIRAETGIPIAVKIGSFYTALPHFVRELDRKGANAVVMFNRFFQPDIDTGKPALKSVVHYSREEDILVPLRWVAILRHLVNCNLSLSTGVHTADNAIKAILAGADTVQICSVLYRRGVSAMSDIVRGIGDWMDANGFANLVQFRGQMAKGPEDRRSGFERAQYVKTLAGLE